ncbi:hypothetical protein ABB27_02460 [Stenotrophomonas terrae]|uniref:Uncharacterized protein n=1 Tax=Stenotrophomonas terrae TaxID=405446 RepID=A0A0R0CP73_9GAMM|nr:hypothetical protein [Stenotrophomonas terrae]KRG71773.1 hypothetical protein ABB27_02460 [Stenotrophomonas terrae]
MTIIAQELRYRIAGAEGTDWAVERIPAGRNIELRSVRRGITYDVEIRNIDHTGRMSGPATFQHTVGTTLREGALALPVNAVANRASVWNVDTSVTYSATDSIATVSVSAGTLVMGGASVNYGASSASVAGTPSTKKTVYLFYDDPQLRGGSVDLGVTDDYITSLAGDGRIAITSMDINFPAVGAPPNTGGGGIGGGGGGGGTKSPVAEQQPV